MAQQTWNALRKQAEDASKPLPEDWYEVTVTKTESTIASTGSPMIKATLDVNSGPQAGNRKVWTQFVMKAETPFVVQMFFQNLAAFGLDENFFNGLPDDIEAGMPIIAQALDGRSARAKIGPRAYNGVDRDNVFEFAPSAKNNNNATGLPGGAAPTGPPTPGAAAAPSVSQGPPTPGASQGNGPAAPPQLAF